MKKKEWKGKGRDREGREGQGREGKVENKSVDLISPKFIFRIGTSICAM